MTAIAFVLLLLLPDGSVIAEVRPMPDLNACEAARTAVLEAAQSSTGVIDAAGACYEARLDPRRNPPT